MLFRPLRFAAPPRPPPARHAGFSLIELTIAVLIVSILLTMGLAAFSVQVEATALSATQKRQDTIKEALIAYLRSNKRLPCPETTGLAGGGNAPIGRENSINGQCTSYVGTLPWLDLGLTKETVLDGYGNFFTYFVAAAASGSDPDWTRTAQPGVTGFSTGSPGRFAIQPTNVNLDGYPLPALATTVIISHGKNGLGAITEKGTRNIGSTDASELANQPPTAAAPPPSWSPQSSSPINYNSMGMRLPAVTATLAAQAAAAGGIFDDVVLVLRPNDLLGPIIRDGAMKSAGAQLSDSFARIKIALASYALSHPNPDNHANYYGGGDCTVTTTAPSLYCLLLPQNLTDAGLTPDDITDPWGMEIQYTIITPTPPTLLDQHGSGNGLSNSNPPPPNSEAYTLQSYGPDRQANTPDDKTLTVSLIELRQMIGPANLPP